MQNLGGFFEELQVYWCNWKQPVKVRAQNHYCRNTWSHNSFQQENTNCRAKQSLRSNDVWTSVSEDGLTYWEILDVLWLLTANTGCGTTNDPKVVGGQKSYEPIESSPTANFDKVSSLTLLRCDLPMNRWICLGHFMIDPTTTWEKRQFRSLMRASGRDSWAVLIWLWTNCDHWECFIATFPQLNSLQMLLHFQHWRDQNIGHSRVAFGSFHCWICDISHSFSKLSQN